MLTPVLVLDGIVEVMVWAEPGTGDRKTFPIPKYTSSAVEEYLHGQLLYLDSKVRFIHAHNTVYSRASSYNSEIHIRCNRRVPAPPVTITICTYLDSKVRFIHAHNTVHSRASCSSCYNSEIHIKCSRRVPARPVTITIYIHCTLSRFKSTRNSFIHAHNTVYSRASCSSWLQGNTWYVG